MKKFVSLLILAMLILSTVCFAAADSKLITYISETETGVNVNVALRGEISNFAAITLGIKYDNENLLINAGSIAVGEALSGWGNAVTPLPTDENPNTGMVYMISVFDNKSNNTVSVSENEEAKILSFDLIKKENAVISKDSVQITDGKNASFVTSLNNISESVVTNTFNASVSPEKFVTVFSPLAAENISSISISGYDNLCPMVVGSTLPLCVEDISADVPVTWSAKGTAEVDENGVVTAKSVGEATVTATLENGVSADCTIDVVEKEVLPTAIEITNTPALGFIGDEYVPVLKFTPESTTDRRVKFSLSNYSNLILNDKTGAVKYSGNASAVLTVKSVAAENATASVNINSANAKAGDVIVAAASAIVPEKLYINATDSVYKTAFSAYTAEGKYIPTIKGFNFGDMYNVEYVLNGTANGVSIANGEITVSKDASAAENLSLTVNIKNKVTGSLVASATSNTFAVVAPVTDDAFTVNGTVVSDGVYSAETPVTIEYSPDVFCTVVANGYAAKATSIPFEIIPAEEGETDVTVYLHSNPVPGILGYSMNSVFKTINFKIVK